MSADKEYTFTIHFTGTLEAADKLLDALVRFTKAFFTGVEVVGFAEDQEVSDEPHED